MSEPNDHANDHALLAQYARHHSEAAFAALAERHLNLVYATALRSVGNPHAAGDISQAVFIILANKAGKLSRRIVLSGWLYQTTRLTAANFLRGEIRRQKREQEAFMQSLLNESVNDTWRHIAPVLDDALGKLGARDRDAIVLRFFENKSLREVGWALGASEDAAKMRVNRALEKLRKMFAQRGVKFSALAIAGSISANSVHAAPVGLAKTISAVAIAKGAAAGGSTLTLVKGALKIMVWTKAKTAVVTTAIVLLGAGTTTVAVKEYQEHRTYSWEVSSDLDISKVSPQVRIVPAKFVNANKGGMADYRGAIGIAMPLEQIIQLAFMTDKSHMVLETTLPTNRYDFVAKLDSSPDRPHKVTSKKLNWMPALQKEIQRKFGVVSGWEVRNTDALLLRPASIGIKGFKISHAHPDGIQIKMEPGNYSFYESSANLLKNKLEQRFQILIINRTGLKGDYDFSLKWNEPDPKSPNDAGLKQALRNQLGLELVPTNIPMQMLVVKKAN